MYHLVSYKRSDFVTVTVVVKEVVINIYVFFGWVGTFVVFFYLYWNCLRSFVDIIFFKGVVKTKRTMLYYYRYLIIMKQTSIILKIDK